MNESSFKRPEGFDHWEHQPSNLMHLSPIHIPAQATMKISKHRFGELMKEEITSLAHNPPSVNKQSKVACHFSRQGANKMDSQVRKVRNKQLRAATLGVLHGFPALFAQALPGKVLPSYDTKEKARGIEYQSFFTLMQFKGKIYVVRILLRWEPNGLKRYYYHELQPYKKG